VTNSAVSAPAVTPKTQQATTPAPTEPTVFKVNLNVPLGKNLSSFTVGGNILGLYLQYWYGFLIGTIGILAAIMIMAGGFIYLTSGGDKGKAGEGQKMISSAITGIVLAFGVYTILYLVNPELLKIKIPSINPVTVDKFDTPPENKDQSAASRGTGTGPSVQSSPQEDNRVRDILTQSGIPVTSSGNCSDCNNPKCTCVGGLTPEAIAGAQTLRTTCSGATVAVTGGTETGHHYGCGGNCVDFQRGSASGYASLDNCIQSTGAPVSSGGARGYGCASATPCYQVGNALYYRENSQHWHVHYNYFPN
jgi:hypothetical protein